MKVLFIVNPVAGRKDGTERITDAVRRALKEERGLFLVRTTQRPGHGARLSEDAVARGFDFVFACGGDGTVNEVASKLVRKNTALGIIPLGRNNTLARTLSIPEDPRLAAGLLRARRTMALDAGLFCERYFFTSAGFGLDADLIKKYGRSLFSTGDFFSRHPGAIREFKRCADQDLSITVDNAFLKWKGHMLTAANTPFYSGTSLMAPGADPTDGAIDLVVLPRMGILNVREIGRRLTGGTIEDLRGYRHVRGRRIFIKRSHITDAHVDGEYYEWIGDITITAVQHGLRVLVP